MSVYEDAILYKKKFTGVFSKEKLLMEIEWWKRKISDLEQERHRIILYGTLYGTKERDKLLLDEWLKAVPMLKALEWLYEDACKPIESPSIL